jgi:hypothetical protein
MDDQAKAAVLAAISARSKEPFSDGELYYPAIDSVQIIYEGTLEDSSARKLLVELYTNFVVCAFVTEKSEAVPKDFLQDLALSLLVNRPLPKIEDLKEQINVQSAEGRADAGVISAAEPGLTFNAILEFQRHTHAS